MLLQLNSTISTPIRERHDIKKLCSYLVSQGDNVCLRYQSKILTLQDWIRQIWLDTSYRYLSIFHHTYDCFIHFNSKKLLQIQHELGIHDTNFRMMIVLLIISSVIDENDDLYISAQEYFKSKEITQLYNSFVIRILHEQYALPILSGGLPGSSVNLSDINQKVESDVAEVNFKEDNWVNQIIDDVNKLMSLKSAIRRIKAAMMEYLANKKRTTWCCTFKIFSPCLVQDTLNTYHKVQGSLSDEEVYSMLYERLLKPLSLSVIKKTSRGISSPYLIILREFTHRSGRFEPFKEKLTNCIVEQSKQYDDAHGIAMNVCHPR